MVKHFALTILLGALAPLGSPASEPSAPFDLSAPFHTEAPIRLRLDTPIPSELLVRTSSGGSVCAFAISDEELRWSRPSFRDVRLYPFPFKSTVFQ
jgi:hypothetical protein